MEGGLGGWCKFIFIRFKIFCVICFSKTFFFVLYCIPYSATTPFKETSFVRFQGEQQAVDDAASSNSNGGDEKRWTLDETRLQAVLREELWRRALRNVYRSQAPLVREQVLERLLYGTEPTADDAGDDAAPASDEAEANSRAREAQFALYARAVWGELAKKKAAAVLRRGAPAFGGLLGADEAFAPRALLPYGVDAALDAQRDAVVAEQLALIADARRAFEYALGADNAEDKQQRQAQFVALVQALRFARAHAAQAIESGTWLNTADAPDQLALLESLHARFEAQRREKVIYILFLYIIFGLVWLFIINSLILFFFIIFLKIIFFKKF